MPKTFHCADSAKLCQCSGFEQCARCRNEVLDFDFDAIGESEINDALGASLISSMAQMLKAR